MTLTLDPILTSAGIDPRDAIVLRHVHVREHVDLGLPGLHADSSSDEILAYTAAQTANPGVFLADPPRLWVVFVKEGGDRARLWSVVENNGEVSNDGTLRRFDLAVSDELADLRNRLVISWPAPRAWWVRGSTAVKYDVLEIADAQPVRFPGFDSLILD